ncbi:PREDICTED: uncharacterized protein LOC109209056 [Nicotiana attenuata]|uniref:Uncharacterized protein n=1 Tax=Nicotiana attenuata TaxID=49451 RepID=A0A314KPI6_NICAT|nr:PREDICTED: uncharacterized protein LOC109209056 [Nicotiana attenuata]OIT31172.1 hypothetical protein A4A49_37799 [Nicotiana attenuata]
MGNFISCTTSPRTRNSKAARVILPNGQIQQFHETVKAAELMLEYPNSFLVNSCSLIIGRRFFALSADEDLEFGNIYVMFSMKRVNSVITEKDMEDFFMTANSKPTPAHIPDNSSGKDGLGWLGLNLNELEGFVEVQEFRYRVSCRSKKPLLETIMEEPISSR